MSSPLEVRAVTGIIVIEDLTHATMFTATQIWHAKDCLVRVGIKDSNPGIHESKKLRAIEMLMELGVMETPREAYLLIKHLIL